MLGRLGGSAVVLLVAAACSGSTISGEGTTGGAAGDTGCRMGAETCPCYGNDTCNGALVCLSEVCVAAPASGGTGAGDGGNESCSPGTESCPCYGNDTCDAGLACLSDVCVQIAGGGGTGGLAMGGAGGTGGRPPTGGVAAAGGNGASSGASGWSATGGVAGNAGMSPGGATPTGGVRPGGAGSTGGVSPTGGALPTGGIGGTGGVIPTGGMAGTGGISWTGGAGGISAGGTGGIPTGGQLGGYHEHADWGGFAFVVADGGATIAPVSYDDLIGQDGPYCASGQVDGTPEYSSLAAVGFNVFQAPVADAPYGEVLVSGTGLELDLTVNGGDAGIRVMLEAADASFDPAHRWCIDLVGSQDTVIPWSSFNTECWNADSGTDFDPATDKVAKVLLYVPDPGPTGGPLSFDFCVNDIGPAGVTGRGTGQLVASCGNTVTWTQASTSEQFVNIPTTDGTYIFQSNGWGWTGGGHSATLLDSCGFTIDTQTCSRTDGSPCSEPSVYVGVNADGVRTAEFTATRLEDIDHIPTCLGWDSDGTPASDEYGVMSTLWLNTTAAANAPTQYLQIWFRDPPVHGPSGGRVADGVEIGDQTWEVWYGPNSNNQLIVSYVQPDAVADGMAYAFDWKDFVNDAILRDYVNARHYAIAVQGGIEIWSGAQGASVTDFRSELSP